MLKLYFYMQAIACLLLLNLQAASAQQSLDIVYKLGDNSEWANRDYDDSDWTFYDTELPVHNEGVFWMRYTLSIGNNTHTDYLQELNITSLMSYELYLDGQLILKNGVVSERKENEIPGLRQAKTVLPLNMLNAGKHVFAFRISAHHSIAQTPYYEHMNLLLKTITSRDVKGGVQMRSLGKFFALAMSLVILIVALYFAILFWNDRATKAYLLLAGLCLCISAIGFLHNFIWIYNFPYNWHYYIQMALLGLVSASLFLMPASFLYLYDLKYKEWWLGVVVGTFLVCLLFSEPQYYSLWILSAGFILSIAIHFVALKQKKEIASLSLIGLFICSIVGFIEIDYFYTAFMILIILILTRLTIIQRRQRELLAYTRLKSVQLEGELIRKNIQPHFILNSLTSLMEWVETEPSKSVDFIAELANEFRLFAEVVGLELIPIMKEIEICNKHLSIMAFRLNGTYVLEYGGLDENETVPPAIFHSLIENAFSHNDYSKKSIDFKLSKKIAGKSIVWILNVPIIGTQTSNFRRIGSGLGTSYVESRLQQSYPDRWTIKAKESGNSWTTQITIL